VNIIPYKPSFTQPLVKPAQAPDGWRPMAEILPAIIEDFGIFHHDALEFGTQHGYSAAALANYFVRVTTVDHFQGDKDAGRGNPELNFKAASVALSYFHNVRIHELSYEKWIEQCVANYDLIHVDIAHNYSDTYTCGRWSLEHADLVIFHDLAYHPVMRACQQLAEEFGIPLYHYDHSWGLGILQRGGRKVPRTR
jgi:hypothetical protein